LKTLYLSDLDGTLLRSNERVSEYTAKVINRFVQNGGCFSYATARSIVTASKVTVGLNTEFPVICNNGAFIIENITRKLLLSNFFTPVEVEYISEILNKHNIYPIVNAFINSVEQVMYIERYVTPAMQSYLDTRFGDPRLFIVENINELYSGEIFELSCMDTDAVLLPIDKIFKSDNLFDCLYQKHPYCDDYCLELLPAKSTKANAALQLKSILSCDRLVVFGDEINDLSLFSVADECYAMSNARPELKEIATAVIESNDNDGVAKWLEENVL